MWLFDRVFRRGTTTRDMDNQPGFGFGAATAVTRREYRLRDMAERHDQDLGELRESIHIEDYDLDDEGDLSKLLDGLDHARKGGSFAIVRTSPKPAASNEHLLELDHLPMIAEAISLIEGDHGGGNYAVIPIRVVKKGGGVRLLKSFNIPGKAKVNADGQSKASGSGQKAAAMSYLETLKDSNPRLAEALQLQIVAKELGITIPKMKEDREPTGETEDDREEREYLEAHPEIREQYILSKLRKKGLRLPKDNEGDDGLRQLEKQVSLKPPDW